MNRDFASSGRAQFPSLAKIATYWLPRAKLPSSRRSPAWYALVVLSCLAGSASSRPQPSTQDLELTRTIRSWEFLPVVGKRAGLFGNETGGFEAWVYPLKIFRNLHLLFHVGGQALPAESLARTLTVRPESASILYAGDSFRVRETLDIPVDQPGAIIFLDVETEQPLEVEAVFTPDFQLEWPAALGGTYVNWDEKQHAFVFGEEAHKFAAVVGSPSGADPHEAYETNYSSSDENSFRLGTTPKGEETKELVIAASVAGSEDAGKTFQRLLASGADMMRESAEYYREYLDRTVSLELPDAALEQAYDWARVSTIQGLVNNPYLGTGLVAGYRTSGAGQRPGFAWFFGRDSLWTSFALNSEGDYATARTALAFISKYQRPDGKVPHEISQSASLVPWFTEYPYPYVSADATPLFIIAMNDYAAQSGDLDFAREKWDSVWRAYQFLRSTYDAQALAQNAGVGHGWVEGGPLLPVKNEYYQAGLGVESLRALSNLARLLGNYDVSKRLAREFEQGKSTLEQAYWSPDNKFYAFALKPDNQRSDELSVLSTVPMWFGLPEASRAEQTITQLAAEEHQTDWGMRIISRKSGVYDGSGYHYGAVWPLFTGWASVGEYRYHREFPAYLNLRSNALLGVDGALGHFTEVLSGDYYESFATSSPHQIWSAAMVVSPILRGMLGLEADAEKHQVTLAPHIPADWTSFAVHNVRVGGLAVDFQYRKTPEAVTLDVTRSGSGDGWLEYSPAFSLRTKIADVRLNGKPVAFKLEPSGHDQHLKVRIPLNEPGTLVIHMKDDFGLSLSNQLPNLGSISRELRVLDESWDAAKTQLRLQVSGRSGRRYELGVWNSSAISSVDGGALTRLGKLQIEIPKGKPDLYLPQNVVIHFRQRD